MWVPATSQASVCWWKLKDSLQKVKQRKPKDNKQVEQKLATCTPWPQRYERPTFISQFVGNEVSTGTQTTCWKLNWDLLLFAGLLHSSQLRNRSACELSEDSVISWCWFEHPETDVCKRAACLMFHNLKPLGCLCKAVWVHSSVSVKLVAVYWPVRPVNWLCFTLFCWWRRQG